MESRVPKTETGRGKAFPDFTGQNIRGPDVTWTMLSGEGWPAGHWAARRGGQGPPRSLQGRVETGLLPMGQPWGL